jgi:hypothetical protein
MSKESAQELFKGSMYLCNDGAVAEGLKFWGSPWSQGRSKNSAFQVTEVEAAEWFSAVPPDVDVLVTHMLEGGSELRTLKQRLRLKLHAGGHLHASHGAVWSETGELKVCACVCDANNRPVQSIFVVDIDRRSDTDSDVQLQPPTDPHASPTYSPPPASSL